MLQLVEHFPGRTAPQNSERKSPGHPVDLLTDKALRPELRPHVEREALRV